MKWEFDTFVVVNNPEQAFPGEIFPEEIFNQKPVVVLDFANCDGHDYKVMGYIMGQAMHTAGFVFNGCWDSDEDNMIAWAESTAQEIFENFFK
jgi:hypothetical protein